MEATGAQGRVVEPLECLWGTALAHRRAGGRSRLRDRQVGGRPDRVDCFGVVAFAFLSGHTLRTLDSSSPRDTTNPRGPQMRLLVGSKNTPPSDQVSQKPQQFGRTNRQNPGNQPNRQNNLATSAEFGRRIGEGAVIYKSGVTHSRELSFFFCGGSPPSGWRTNERCGALATRCTPGISGGDARQRGSPLDLLPRHPQFSPPHGATFAKPRQTGPQLHSRSNTTDHRKLSGASGAAPERPARPEDRSHGVYKTPWRSAGDAP